MIHRNRQSLLIALLAALQLVLQPLAATAWCAVGLAGAQDDCCCGHVEESPERLGEEPAGCCGPRTVHPTAPDRQPDPGDGVDEHGAPCACYSAPGLPPATHPQAPEGLRPAFAATAPVESCVPLPTPFLDRGAPLPRVRLPGGGPPLRLLIQVFRL